MKFLMEIEELFENLDQSEIRVVDCRFTLGHRDQGESAYRLSHIPGAVYFHLEKDLSGEVKDHGGRHPLPEMRKFAEKLKTAGIGNNDTLVVYDGGDYAFASRFYWMMKYAGHEKVYLLNGGYHAWVQAGYPVTSAVPQYAAKEFTLDLQEDLLTNYETIKQFTEKKAELILIDSREEKRFRGEEEKIDKASGHIPGAINKVWLDAIANNRFKSAEEQKDRFRGIDKNQKIVVYCGSGVTAAPNYIALKMAGYQYVSVYIGSFSDYISYEGNPIETDS
ncbi:thiosulfate/3-mercaptopyruvate sulfurtransferase [Peribacillus deserti]|uniref:Thiosulfate/3-mercaptopyruvate sulfurtransferase n=1 Tax=Peribacillus deserti TaxID=673318 RepID=A0ABS2QIF3_9BACI|nr:sulfurtransferase [Peribacillus deserti]MBM7692579.1 thiosulfate/3-mercaptopyruvate sulfurtransferase [Peribacillus deserti]